MGGQAVLEGVMMQEKRNLAVRDPEGIVVESQRISLRKKKSSILS